MSQCQRPRYQIRLIFGLLLYLVGNYRKNLKVPEAQLNINSARAITWFVGVTIYCAFFNDNSPPPRQFLCNKILLKKISYSKGNAHRIIFELVGPGPPGHTGCPIICGTHIFFNSLENLTLIALIFWI